MIANSVLGVGLLTPLAAMAILVWRLWQMTDADMKEHREELLHLVADISVIGAFLLDAWITLRGQK